jgi:hypothetical protein
MPDSVNSLLTVEIKGGPPKISAAHNVTVEAYERIQVNVPGTDGTGTAVTLNLLPADSKAKIFAITSSRYGDGLTYKGAGTAVALDGPQLFTGGSVQLLGSIATLTVTNALGAGKDATVTILVGRDVAPPPPKTDSKTQDTSKKTPDTGTKTPDTGTKTPDTGTKTPDTGAKTPDTGAKT